MKRILAFALATGLLLILGGCASSVMTKAPSPELKPPPAGMAQIVFMRDSFVASAIGCDLLQVDKGGKLKFIGVVANATKIAYLTPPGHKVFMAYGTVADFMEANVVAGKTYFVILRPNWGTGGFAPTPIRQRNDKWSMQNPDFNKWLNDTELVTANAKAPGYFQKNKADFDKLYTRYWARFLHKNPVERRERTLQPQDGR